jgi:hypothetical protein
MIDAVSPTLFLFVEKKWLFPYSILAKNNILEEDF